MTRTVRTRAAGARAPDDHASATAVLNSLRRGLTDDDAAGPLWRAAQVFRAIGFLYALGFLVAVDGDLLHPGITWVLFAALTAANAASMAGYLHGFARRGWWVSGELAVSAAMMLSTSLVADKDWIAHNQTWPTTLWMASAVLSAALVGGARAGFAGAVVIGAANYFVKGEIVLNMGRNATMILLAAAAVAVGMAATRARVTHERLTAAVGLAARSAERDRLAREVHDGVLQALALIARRGREIGGPTEELATLAAGQERSLRRLIAEEPPAPRPQDARSGRDLGPELRARASDRIHVSTPADPVVLPAAVADEVLAAVANVLDNVARHAGAGAHTYILLEDLGDEVVVSVRDDGAGIPPGRLQEAAAEGRMGVSRSIIGRVERLGGRARLESAPGSGTEWELTVPAVVVETDTARKADSR
ncbi:MacS family sensor histidine kinase [Tomitella fengzijianii]|uniref:ATP-binding protein n=1 Tax=Tomitella fengzijianii TaxID=2597660 RepID=A0A516X1M6_9ACTN|nr:DUF5931 domain-containing protein [Tomitella fengzijianii]QDQ96930.1 ATP-binding protein [Tomitella fengzijianii]